MKYLLIFILFSSFCVSCSNDSGQLVDKSETSSPSQPSVADSGSQEQSLPQGHPPIGNDRQAMQVREQPAGASSGVEVEGTTAKAGGLAFTIAPEWQSAPPSSSMRAAQFSVPAAEGDPEGGELVLFQGIGGSAKMNLDRWVGQFKQPAGAEPKMSQNELGPLTVYTLDVSGDYSASVGPMMMAQTVNKSDYRMLAAVVEGPGGPWHIKLTGPQATVEQWKPAFDRMIDSLIVAQ